MRHKKLSKNILTILLIVVLTSSSVVSFTAANPAGEEVIQPADDVTVIRIAKYPGTSNSEKSFEMIFNYTWSANDNTYRFICEELTKDELKGDGERPLNVDNYDLLVLGANYWSYGFDGWTSKPIVQTIKTFFAEGGGYLGACAGATFVSQGFDQPKDIHAVGATMGSLKVVNVYLNQDLGTEMQYCIRSKNGLPSIETLVERDNGNPIFATYMGDTINLTFGGGAAMYNANVGNPMLGEVVPLLTYNEELMETKPLHHWGKRIIGWAKGDTLKTDYLGQYCAVAATYNNSGRIVAFSSHAEIPLIMNATIEERIEKRNSFSSLGIAPLPVYYLVDGEYINISYNWWIYRRAAAWAAHVPDEDLPPCNELMVFMVKPMVSLYNQFYFRDSEVGKYFNFSLLNPPFNFPRIQNSWLLSRIFGKFVSKKLMNLVEREGMPIIAGDITIQVYAENSDIVEFYLDGELVHTATQRTVYHEGMQGWVFEWEFDTNNLNGVHKLELRAYDEYGNYVTEGSDFLIYSI